MKMVSASVIEVYIALHIAGVLVEGSETLDATNWQGLVIQEGGVLDGVMRCNQISSKTVTHHQRLDSVR